MPTKVMLGGALVLAVMSGQWCCAAESTGADATIPSVVVSGLRCEYLKDPLGIDVGRPRLSWKLVATETGH